MIDRIKARALGLSIGDVNGTLAIAFGSAYANDFTRDGRILRVLLQADAPYRMTPEDVLALKVRNASGEMVPFSSFTQVEWTSGPQQLQRYRSEEHTSELQSLMRISYAVFCLKKKKTTHNN